MIVQFGNAREYFEREPDVVLIGLYERNTNFCLDLDVKRSAKLTEHMW